MNKYYRLNLHNKRFLQLAGFEQLSLLGWGCWLAGGAARSIFKQEKINDYDIFFKDKEFAEIAKTRLEQQGAKRVFECPAGELTTYKISGMKIQLITKRFYKSIEECLESFDFTCCIFGFDGVTFYTTKEAMKDVKYKNLTLNKLTYPVASINRIYKYKKRGYAFQEVIIEILSEIQQAGTSKAWDTALYID